MNITLIKDLGDQHSTLIIPVMSDDKLPDLLKKVARRYALDPDLLSEDFNGSEGAVLSTYSRKKGTSFRLFLVGLGGNPDGSIKKLRKFFHTHSKTMGSEATVAMDYLPARHQVKFAHSMVVAFITSLYDLGLYKTGDKKRPEIQLNLFSRKELNDTIERAMVLAQTQVRIMDLVNAPANKMTPAMLGEWALQSGKEFGYEVEVFGKKSIVDHELNALLAVNQGSDLPPSFIIARHTHAKAARTIGFVGKGVTFDTGGLSIKGSANMHYMKSDMGGAAAVLGTIEVAARLNLPVNIVAIVPATENSVGASAYKPGDIIHSYSGKSIEVIDTDAEGRLILADAIAYLTKNYEVDYLVDYATLTGSVIATLGYHAAGIFTKNEELLKQMNDAASHSGEKIWPLPLWHDYEEDLESDVADVKNYSGKPLAGAITAAKFLEVFTNDHPAWAHLDIAGVAFADSEFGKQKNATAYGVSLNLAFLEALM